MAATAKRKITLSYFGDLAGVEEINAADNNNSPGQVQVITLAMGDNVITAPSSGTVPVSCTIVKPPGNAIAVKLKGIAGDTGIRLHNTDPDTISIDPATASFVLNAAAQIAGVRLFWA